MQNITKGIKNMTTEKINVTTLPQNIEAEQALLGTLLANNKAFEQVSDFLKPIHFADSVNAKIYEVLSKLIFRGHVADTITLKNYFEQEGILDDVGGYKYLIKRLTFLLYLLTFKAYL